jgi:hypothetical protein
MSLFFGIFLFVTIMRIAVSHKGWNTDPPVGTIRCVMAMRWLRFLIGLILLPCGIAVTRALVSTANATQPETSQTFSPSFLVFFGGFTFWLIVFVTLPQSTRAYVLAHELTHALWAKVMGKKVLGMEVGAQTGSVVVSESNALITLAPYFFPLYTVLVILVYYGLAPFTDVEPWRLPWLALVGLTWSFHVTFTVSTLMAHQSDIVACGRLFSYTFIYLMNVLSVALWMILVSDATVLQFGRFLWNDLVVVWTGVFRYVSTGMNALRELCGVS